MTAYPEGYLARELELCYANISLITDYDVGAGSTTPVSRPVSHARRGAGLRGEQRPAA